METYCPHCKQVVWPEAAKQVVSAVTKYVETAVTDTYEHLAAKHGSWSCPFCNKAFANVQELNQHHRRDACDPDNRDKVETAEVHWDYTEKMMRLAYVEAFKHGYKHGREDAKVKESPKVSSY